jgi:hypothetical protein
MKKSYCSSLLIGVAAGGKATYSISDRFRGGVQALAVTPLISRFRVRTHCTALHLEKNRVDADSVDPTKTARGSRRNRVASKESFRRPRPETSLPSARSEAATLPGLLSGRRVRRPLAIAEFRAVCRGSRPSGEPCGLGKSPLKAPPKDSAAGGCCLMVAA